MNKAQENVFKLYQQQLLELKPLLIIADKQSINILTKYASECLAFHSVIVQAIYQNWKGELGFLYLIDSILKNVGKQFLKSFGNIEQELVKHFHHLDLDKSFRLLSTWSLFNLEMPLNDIISGLFKKQLGSLQGNDKLVINALTKSAQYVLNPVIVDCIYGYIDKCVDKLSVVYLVDSILKNVGGKYIEYFNGIDKLIIKLYLNEPEMRTRIAKLVDTWQPIFPAEYIENIKQHLKTYSQPETIKKLEYLLHFKSKLKKTDALVQEVLVLQKLLGVLKSRSVDQQTLVKVEQKIFELRIVPTIKLSQESIDSADATEFFDLIQGSVHQCKQCALRFETKIKLQEHLDWHFRQNKVRKENKVVISRDWYLPCKEWIIEQPLDKETGN